MDVQRAPVPDRLIATIERVPGVKVAAGTVQGYAQLVGKDGKAIRAEKAPLLGTNWLAERELSVTSLAVGHGPVGGDQIAIDARTFTHGGFRLGDRATVLSAHAPRQFTIVGSVDLRRRRQPGRRDRGGVRRPHGPGDGRPTGDVGRDRGGRGATRHQRRAL